MTSTSTETWDDALQTAPAPDGPVGVAAPKQGPVLPCDIRPMMHQPGRSAQVYQTDQSGTVRYDFNSCGYRGEDFDPDARFRLVIVGESTCFGNGVAIEHIFATHLKRHVAAALHLPLHTVNVINLSVGGSSSDYCARTILRQIPRFAVDLVVCGLPSEDRFEYCARGVFANYIVNGIEVSKLSRAPEALLGYCDYYNPEVGRINRLKNVLVIQGALRALGVSGVIAIQGLETAGRAEGHLAPFHAALDPAGLLVHSFFEIKADLAADDRHAGPRTHAAFAIALLHFCGGVLTDPDAGQALRREAEQLMQTDPDWAYYNAFVADLAANGDIGTT